MDDCYMTQGKKEVLTSKRSPVFTRSEGPPKPEPAHHCSRATYVKFSDLLKLACVPTNHGLTAGAPQHPEHAGLTFICN